ncbi:MAG: hypothetical protein ABI433_01890 [Burkholderiaceae bacterium]
MLQAFVSVLVLLFSLMRLANAAPECSVHAADETPVLQRIDSDVWHVAAARGEANESNRGATIALLLARDGARLWLVGSGPTPAFGAALDCAIRRTLGRRVTDVINTRAAPELALGNPAFDGARLWALPEVIDAMHTRCGGCLERLAGRLGAAGLSLRAQDIRVPFLPVASRGAMAGRLGPFDWRKLARAPGEPVLVLRHRTSRIIVAQGLLWADDVPDLRETRSDTLLASLRSLQHFTLGARVLGEQGDVAKPAAIAANIAYLEALHRAVDAALARGDVQGAAGLGIELPAFAELPGYAARHALNVQHVWRERELRSFDTAPGPRRAGQAGRSPTFQRSLR